MRLQGLKSLATFTRPPGVTSVRAFSLVELMIAIVILGLGLVLVASMFPIAWQRARDLNDFTNTTSCTEAAEEAVKLLCKVSNTAGVRTSFIGDNAVWSTDAANMPVVTLEPLPGYAVGTLPTIPIHRVRPLLTENAHFVKTDSSATATYPESPLSQSEPVDFPDLTTRYVDATGMPVWGPPAGAPPTPVAVPVPQIPLWERVFPAMPRWEWSGLPTLANAALIARWRADLEARRYAWAVLCKLDLPRLTPDPVPNAALTPPAPRVEPPLTCIRGGLNGADDSSLASPGFTDDVPVLATGMDPIVLAPGANGIIDTPLAGDDHYSGTPSSPLGTTSSPVGAVRPGEPRTFTMYYVTLKRTDPTQAFAVQAVDMGLTPPAVNPASPMPSNQTTTALPPAQGMTLTGPHAAPQYRDVLFPVPWRVQVKVNPNVDTTVTPPIWAAPAGLPSTAIVPDPAATGLSDDQIRAMLAMFSVGQVFIDEVSGEVYRVTRRVLSKASPPHSPTLELDQATLTLDKEIQLHVDTIDDNADGDFTNANWGNWTLDAGEDVRTVWVYPPPIERRGAAYEFIGPSPVAGIEIRKLRVQP